jgi:cytoskeletal protein RodZ
MTGSPNYRDCASLGLAARREKKSISLEQIAESTKIAVRSLRAIEAGEFKKLPGGIYNTSYIRQYAQAIDFDESEILAAYYSVMGISADAQEPPAPPAGSYSNLVTRFLRHTSTVLSSL